MNNGSMNNERSRRRKRILRLAIVGPVLVLVFLLLALVFGVWDLGVGISSVPPTPTSWPRVRLASPEYGMQAFLWWNEEMAKLWQN